jgi:hypothetical protein
LTGNDDPLLLSWFFRDSVLLQVAKTMLDDEFGKVFMGWYPTRLAAAATASRISYNPMWAQEELEWFGAVCATGLHEGSKLSAR